MLPAPLWLALVRAMLVVDDGTRITPLSLHGEGKEEAASPQKRKPTPPRCARQPLPREGASVDAPSFLWKEGECRLTDFPRRRLTIREYRFSRYNAFPKGGRLREGGFAAPKGSQPRLAAHGSPVPRNGLAWILPPSYGEGFMSGMALSPT